MLLGGGTDGRRRSDPSLENVIDLVVILVGLKIVLIARTVWNLFAIIGSLVLRKDGVEIVLNLLDFMMLIEFLDHLLEGVGLTLLAKVDPVSVNLLCLAHLNVRELELVLSPRPRFLVGER